VLVESRPKEVALHTRASSAISITSASYPRNAGSPIRPHPSPSSPEMIYGNGAQVSRESSSPSESSPSMNVDHRNVRISSSSHTRNPNFAQRQAGSFPPALLQHQSSSLSSHTRSESSDASSALPITPADDPWHQQSLDRKVQGSEWPSLYNALLANSPAITCSRLPCLQSSDRVSEIPRDLDQRTLPLPAPRGSSTLRSPSGGYSQNPTSGMQTNASRIGPMQARDEMSLRGSPENDAANTLAVLKSISR
jgi:hypothetical protein